VQQPQRTERGASAVEYAILVAAIAAVIVIAAGGIGISTVSNLQQGCDRINERIAGDC
jgi:Flp pilus assembly pilin Flp